jgi:hypothetical protein
MTVVNVPTDKAPTCVVCLRPNGHALGFEGRARYITIAVTALGVPAEQSALLVADAWPPGAEEAEIWVRVCAPCIRRASAADRVPFPPPGNYGTRRGRQAPLTSEARVGSPA